jgi:peptidoglycan/xylan/chitin deacetylase (PgdA/CDA1 family)
LTGHVDIIVIYDNYEFSSPIEYTFNLILSIYGVAYEIMPFNQFKAEEHDLGKTLVISYGREYLNTWGKRQIHIYASDFFGKNYLKPASMPETPLRKYRDLPVIYRGCGAFDSWIRKSQNLIETNIDIVASSFFMLSRYEEVVQDAKDEHGRFPAKASLAYKEGFLVRPIVNEYIELLWNWIEALKPEMVRRPFWPDNRDFAVCLTHDVDWLKKYSLLPPVISIGSAALRQRNLRLSFSMASYYLGTLLHLQKDPFDTFDYMLNLEHKHGFKSSFYFMAGGISEFDNRYSITEPKLMRLLRQIEDRGCEIGTHASYNSYNRLEHIMSEKTTLDKVLANKSTGCRQHYLRWKTPDTWRLQGKAGFLYDATLGFADHVGFRCGICLPYQPFDVVENRKLNIWELPLIAQDATLQSVNYQNLPPDNAYREIVKHIDKVKGLGGVFVLLWHNSSFDPLGGWTSWKQVYEKALRYISRQNAFVETSGNIIKWWQANSTLR